MSTVVPIAVFAETDQSVQTDTAEQSTADTEEKTKKATRIQEYKDKVAEKISQSEENRVAGLCKGAQTVVTNMQTKLDKALENRQTTYQRISDRLAELVAKLKVAGADTAELEAAVASVDAQSAQVIALIQTHQTTLSDLSSMDCATDPAGFKAALSSARDDRKAIVAASQSLRQYVTDNLKPILKTIRENLAAKEAQTESEQ